MARAVIKAECKTIDRGEGRKDVVVTVPLVQLKGQVTEEQWQAIEQKYGDRVNEKFKIRAKTPDDAKSRAYRVAEKHGANLTINE